MATTFEDKIRTATHRIHDQLWEMSELPLTDPAGDAAKLREWAKQLTALSLVCEMAAMQGEGVAS